MQSRTTRVALVIAAVAVLVVALLVLRPTDDDEEQPQPAAGETRTVDEGGATGAATKKNGGQEPRKPQVPQIELRNGEPVGAVEEIEVETGDRVEFEVRSDAPDEIHVHGYELTEPVGPHDPARFSFPADIDGIFEVEAHAIGDVQIAELRVTPG